MGCVGCGECCKKFLIKFKLKDGANRARERGIRYLNTKFTPDPKFEEFLKVMGVRTGDIRVRVPIEMIPEGATKMILRFNRVCTEYDEEGKMCRIHDHKPQFCREWFCGNAQSEITDILIPDEVRVEMEGEDDFDISAEEVEDGGEGDRAIEGRI